MAGVGLSLHADAPTYVLTEPRQPLGRPLGGSCSVRVANVRCTVHAKERSCSAWLQVGGCADVIPGVVEVRLLNCIIRDEVRSLNVTTRSTYMRCYEHLLE
jgi:hypothetical protein